MRLLEFHPHEYISSIAVSQNLIKCTAVKKNKNKQQQQKKKIWTVEMHIQKLLCIQQSNTTLFKHNANQNIDK